jgi:hypothetical protein
MVGAEGVVEVDPDSFAPSKNTTTAYFSKRPYPWDSKVDPSDPWFKVNVPVPPALGETTDIQVEMVRLTIKPKLPPLAPKYQGESITVGFDNKHGDSPPSNPMVYRVPAGEALVFDRIQPGDYWLSVGAPGTVTPGGNSFMSLRRPN